MFQIRQAAGTDRTAIHALLSLAHAGEPTHRLRQEDVLYVADSDAGLIGVGGLDPCDEDVGLLHSLLVRPGFRKRRIARQLYQHVLDHAYALGLRELYALTASGRTYYETLGFTNTGADAVPAALVEALRQDDFDPEQTALLHRSLTRSELVRDDGVPAGQADPACEAAIYFDTGFHCAESVLLALSRHMGLDSPWIPRIASGFCSGQSRSWGACGAHSGGVMALSLALGRDDPASGVGDNYQAIRRFTEEFKAACGSCSCAELMGCDLDSADGQRMYRDDHLHAQCREYVIIATRLAQDLLPQADIR